MGARSITPEIRFFPGAISPFSQTADEPTPGTEYAASINLHDKDVKVHGWID